MNPDSLLELKKTTDRLRALGGCEWDRKQDFQSMRKYLLEETYEALDAINRSDARHLQEELGDLLFLVFFFCRLAEEENLFTLPEVAAGINEKLIRRHPHVFADLKVSGTEEILANWERIKAGEKAAQDGKDAQTKSNLSLEISRKTAALPGLMRAQVIGKMAAPTGLDWEGAAGVFPKINEELEELRAAMHAGDSNQAEEELGDLLFTLAQLGRHLKLDTEIAMHRSAQKFLSRFENFMKLHAGNETPADVEELWQKAKQMPAQGARDYSRD